MKHKFALYTPCLGARRSHTWTWPTLIIFILLFRSISSGCDAEHTLHTVNSECRFLLWHCGLRAFATAASKWEFMMRHVQRGRIENALEAADGSIVAADAGLQASADFTLSFPKKNGSSLAWCTDYEFRNCLPMISFVSFQRWYLKSFPNAMCSLVASKHRIKQNLFLSRRRHFFDGFVPFSSRRSKNVSTIKSCRVGLIAYRFYCSILIKFRLSVNWYAPT